MPLTTLQIIQGKSRDFRRQTPNDDGTFGGIFAGTEPITYTVWPAGDEAAVLSLTGPPNAWVDATATIWLISFRDAQTATLTPGTYRLQVTAPIVTGRTGVLFEGLLEIVASGGTTVPTPAPLITDTTAANLLTSFGLSAAQWEVLPDLILAASDVVRRECLGRDFILRTYTEDCPIAFDGTVRVSQIPINQVLRVQASPRVVLSITNESPSVQAARVTFATAGDLAIGQTVTGLTLAWSSGGVASSHAINFTAGMTIAGLETAINAVGSGWSAEADDTLGSLPVTELISTGLAMGASGDATAGLRAYGEALANVRFHPDSGQRTGLLCVGRHPAGLGPRWGPGWDDFDDTDDGGGTVRVTYSAGFATVPAVIQQATVEVLKAGLTRLASDDALASESGADYSYAFRDAMDLIPAATRQALARWAIWNA